MVKELQTAMKTKNTLIYMILLVVASGGLLLFSGSVAAKRAENTQDPSELHLKTGISEANAGHYTVAIDELLQSIYFARNNYQPMAYFYLGRCYKVTGQDSKAIEAYTKHLLQNLGPSPDAHVDLGEIYMRNNRDREAEVEFNKSLVDYQGPAPRAHNALGKLLEKRGELLVAQWQFLQALGEHPWSYTPAWVNLAENYMKQSEWNEAIKQLIEILDHAGSLKGLDKARIHMDLGGCLIVKGDHQGALENWRQSCEINPDLADPHLLLARLFDQEKHLTSALHEYQAFIRLAGDNHPALKEAKDRILNLDQQLKTTEEPPAPSESVNAGKMPALQPQESGF